MLDTGYLHWPGLQAINEDNVTHCPVQFCVHLCNCFSKGTLICADDKLAVNLTILLQYNKDT